MNRAAAPPPGHKGLLPWVSLRSASSGPLLFRRMLGAADPKARPGDLVSVYDKTGTPYGVALYNPKSLVSLRMLSRGPADNDPDALFEERLTRAVELRRDVLKLDAATDAYRLVYAEGDGLSGLVVDRFADRLVLEFYSLGMFRQAERIERILGKLLPGLKTLRRSNEAIETLEGFRCPAPPPGPAVRVTENGVRFLVDNAGGYKTGFFCDQRENRLALAALSGGRKVLDVCSFTGGFGIYAKKVGGASEATCVDLDPAAEALARKNANLNQVRVETVQADAFPYLRQAAANARSYGLVALDPSKLIATKEGFGEGRQKYFDLNKLAMALIEPGGLLVSCSCSGLLGWEEFLKIVRGAAAAAGRRLQVFRKSGAGADHPVSVDYPEGEYLKVLWCRVLR